MTHTFFIETLLPLILLSVTLGIALSLRSNVSKMQKQLDNIEEILNRLTKEEEAQADPVHPFFSFLTSLVENYTKGRGTDGRGITFADMDNLANIPTHILSSLREKLEQMEQYEDAAKVKAELDKRGAAN